MKIDYKRLGRVGVQAVSLSNYPPGALTTALQLTPGPNEALWAESARMYLRRWTPAAPANRALARLWLDGVGVSPGEIARVTSYSNDTSVVKEGFFPIRLLLQEGDILKFQIEDLSTGGTMDYDIYVVYYKIST